MGFHSRITLDLGFMWENPDKPDEEQHLYYSVCEHCNDGHPMITGEW